MSDSLLSRSETQRIFPGQFTADFLDGATFLGERPPPPPSTSIEFTIDGKAEPAGSKQAFVPTDKKGQPFRKNGRIIVSVVDDNPKSKGWKECVAFVARQHYKGPLLTGPLRFTVTIHRVRPNGHWNKARTALSKDGRDTPYPTSKPDVLKMTRAIEDALTSVIWQDDAQIVEEHLYKYWGDSAKVVVKIETID